ncbi:MAG: hypothetical protein ABSC17_07165 [Thermacetogeniaceae bacterium]
MKMKHVYQLTDELSVGSELQLQRWRDLLGLVGQQYQAKGTGSLQSISRERIQGLMAEIDETARELAALRGELEQSLHLKQFELHRLRYLHQTPSAARLEAIWRDQSTVMEDLCRLWDGDRNWLEGHLQQIRVLLQEARVT